MCGGGGGQPVSPYSAEYYFIFIQAVWWVVWPAVVLPTEGGGGVTLM